MFFCSLSVVFSTLLAQLRKSYFGSHSLNIYTTEKIAKTQITSHHAKNTLLILTFITTTTSLNQEYCLLNTLLNTSSNTLLNIYHHNNIIKAFLPEFLLNSLLQFARLCNSAVMTIKILLLNLSHDNKNIALKFITRQ